MILPRHSRAPPIQPLRLATLEVPQTSARLGSRGMAEETNMSDRSVRPLITILILGLVGGLLLSVSDTSFSQEKKKLAWSAKAEHTKFIGHPILEIPDVPGHAIRSFEIRRTYPDNPPMIEGLKVVEEVARGFSDQVLGNGRGWGYTVWRLENGDQMYSEWQNATQAVVNPDRSRRASFVGTYVTTGGTGKVRGAKGFGRYTGVTEVNAEGQVTRNEYSAEGEYWIEK
jgi:hypothetical protein